MMLQKRLAGAVLAGILLCGMAPSAEALRPRADHDADYLAKAAALVQQNWSEDYFGVVSFTLDQDTMCIDGVEQSLDPGRDTKAMLRNNRVMIPARSLVEATGGEISYDAQTNRVSIQREQQFLQLRPGETQMEINGQIQQTDTAPFVQDGRTYLSLRAVAEGLGYEVEWDGAQRTASITNTMQTKRLIVGTDGTSVDFNAYAPSDLVAMPDNTYVLQFNSVEAAQTCMDALSGNPAITYAEPDIYLPAIQDTVAAQSPYGTGHLSWGADRMGTDDFLASLTSAQRQRAITVAVCDTGVDSAHSFLSGRLLGGANTVGGSTAVDGNGHGTHVSGTIVDCTPDMNVKILPVKVLDDSGSGTNLAVANGVAYAVSQGADIINLSLGGISSSGSHYLDQVISSAVNGGCTVVIAAGNEAMDVRYSCPAHNSDAIVVAAVDAYDNRASFSNYGSYVDIAAPGVSITSCVPGGGYETWNGTSMAAPHISAAAALLLASNSNITPRQIETKLRGAAEDVGSPGWDSYYGAGIVNLSRLDSSVPTAPDEEDNTTTPTVPDAPEQDDNNGLPTTNPTPVYPTPVNPAPVNPVPVNPIPVNPTPVYPPNGGNQNPPYYNTNLFMSVSTSASSVNGRGSCTITVSVNKQPARATLTLNGSTYPIQCRQNGSQWTGSVTIKQAGTYTGVLSVADIHGGTASQSLSFSF